MSTGARYAFLQRLIDDAGLFPPAKLPMGEALAEHVGSRSGEHAYALGRFLCPASKVEEFVAALPQDVSGISVSLVCEAAQNSDWYAALQADLRTGLSIAAASGGRARLDALEIRLASGDAGTDMIERLAGDRFGHAAQAGVFLEIPLGSDWEYRIPHTIAQISQAGFGAKLRCGGLTPQAFPSPAQVARFLCAARDHKVRIKATAGLHHPIRHTQPGSGFPMHGFLNVVGAAVLCMSYDLDIPALEQVLWDENPSNFSLNEDAFSWHEYRCERAAIERTRSDLFDAYGSCSFKEPVDDLMALGIL